MMGHLDKLVGPTAESMGYDVVRVTLIGSGRATLQVMAERQDDQPMTVSDCEALSRALSALLDVEDPVAGAYFLEVSSPGLDRPLTRPRDYDRFKGREARVETDRLIDGQRRFRGIVDGLVDTHTIRLQLVDVPEGESAERLIPFGAITRAKLLVTDEVIAESLKAAKDAETRVEQDTSDPQPDTDETV